MAPNNRFTPPNAKVEDLGQAKPGSPAKAVLAGLAVDILGAVLGGIVVGLVYAAYLGASGMSPAEMRQLAEHPPSMPLISVAGLAVGCGFSVLGGYVCSLIAKRSEYRLGLVLAAISVVLGLLLQARQLAEAPGQVVVSMLLTLGSVILGSHLGRRRNQRALTFPST